MNKTLSTGLVLTLISISLLGGCNSGVLKYSARGYRVKSQNVRWGKQTIEGARPESFEIARLNGLQVPWATDCDRVYFRNLVVEHADPTSFKVLDKDWACDQRFLYRGRLSNRRVAGFLMVKTESGLRIDRQDGFDTATLRIIHRDRYNTWFADKDHVYMDASGSLFSAEATVEHADPDTFHFDSATKCWMDKNFVFGIGTNRISEEVDGMVIAADAASWRRVTSDNGPTQFFTDKNHVWFSGRLLPGANPSAFRLLNDYYSTDGDHVWRGKTHLKQADPQSFHLVGGKPFDKFGPIDLKQAR